jgi:hypothetical protein
MALRIGSGQDPVVNQSATPPGWQPVDVGDVQLSVPKTWEMVSQTGQEACGSASAGVLVFEGGLWCPSNMNTASPPGVSVVTISTITARTAEHPGRRMTVNGIPVFVRTDGDYVVPALHSELTFAGPAQTHVLHSLTYSPRYVALLAGATPPVPRSWRWVSLAHLKFAVPKPWKVSVQPHEDFCSSNNGLSVAGVTLGEGPAEESAPVSLGPCGLPDLESVPLVAGVEVDEGAWGEVPSLFDPPRCAGARFINDLPVCIRATPDRGLLIVQIGYGGAAPVTVRIGMAGNGTAGRIILHSLRST